MNGIELKNLYKCYGANVVVNDLSMAIGQGERLILLGPSGCGKTTTLRMIAGLETISSGTLEMGGRAVNEVASGDRNVAMVFQNYALFPHMTVWDNVTFGLTMRSLPKDEIAKRTEEALAMLNLTGMEQRRPRELSGGQKQRVALARALVKQAPVFLLDEPLSNLDAQLRQQARTELVKLHDLFKPTMIYVTHDQVEATTIGHRIAVMNQGRLQQLDTPDAIYRYPANTFVAGFIGAPPMNLLKGSVEGSTLQIGGGLRLEIPAEWQQVIAQSAQVTIGIRPEQCVLTASPLLAGAVEMIENLGSQRCAHVRLPDGQKMLSVFPGDASLPEGSKGIAFDWQHVNLFDSASGENLGWPLRQQSSVA